MDPMIGIGLVILCFILYFVGVSAKSQFISFLSALIMIVLSFAMDLVFILRTFFILFGIILMMVAVFYI